MNNIINKLIQENKTISTMESCTGGMISNAITNVEGSSNVFNFGAVTYSNEYKIKLGVDSKIIDKYTVYSIETAKEMSKKITDYTNSDYGIGITGKLNKEDINNPYGSNNKVFISLYIKEFDKYITSIVDITKNDRNSNKQIVLEEVINMLKKEI